MRNAIIIITVIVGIAAALGIFCYCKKKNEASKNNSKGAEMTEVATNTENPQNEKVNGDNEVQIGQPVG